MKTATSIGITTATDAETINLLRRAYKTLYRAGLTTAEAVGALTTLAAENPVASAAIGQLRDFVRDSQRGIIR